MIDNTKLYPLPDVFTVIAAMFAEYSGLVCKGMNIRDSFGGSIYFNTEDLGALQIFRIDTNLAICYQSITFTIINVKKGKRYSLAFPYPITIDAVQIWFRDFIEWYEADLKGKPWPASFCEAELEDVIAA